MTKRFQLFKHKNEEYILDEPNTHLDFIEMLGDALSFEEIVDLLNAFNEENEQLKEVINQLFNTITELDWAKEEYCNALIRLLGEENDVDKAKQRIREFLE